MRIGRILPVLAIFAVVFGLFVGCESPTNPNSDPGTPTYYTVQFETNGGSPAPYGWVVAGGGKITQPAPLTKTGFDFDGWYKEADCINQWDFAKDTVTGSIILYAKWIPLDGYTINFEPNGGTPAPQQQTVAEGDKITPPSAMTKTGYGFGGWYKEADCINQWDFANDTVTGDITLYAKWDTHFYIVSFDAKGGDPAPDQENIAHGGEIVEPPPMNKEGYAFGGWYKEADCINQWDFANDTVTKDITLYAKWNLNTTPTCTVNFEANSGTPAPQQQTVAEGGKITQPSAMTKTGYGFAGWYKETDCINQWDFAKDTVTGDITLYAKWEQLNTVPGATLIDKLVWLNSYSENDKAYVIEVDAYYDIAPQNLFFLGRNNVTIYLRGTGSMRTISLASNGSLFTIGSGITLVLDKNITLWGRQGNNAPLVSIETGGSLIMNPETKITSNTNTTTGSSSASSSGGGVRVAGGTFEMNGGEISGNRAFFYGGGVYVYGGTFEMNGGEISGNRASPNGGGVGVDRGTFGMNGGEISGNTASSSGGGVYVGGTFEMNGGEISGNTVSSSSSYPSSGGGVYVDGTFEMNGGEISGNTVSSSSSSSYPSSGGGVCVGRGTFEMNGGEISGNTASYGGGVSGSLTMNGGEISGNRAFYGGGGVYLNGSSIQRINKTGGIITGYSTDMVNGNVVKNDSDVIQDDQGHAVYADHSNILYMKRKETTAGPKDNLSYTGKSNPLDPPLWDGDWDN